MRIISRKMLREFEAKHPQSRGPLELWYWAAKHADWESYDDVRAEFGKKVDQVSPFVVFDVGGNKYRVIVLIDYEHRCVCMHAVLTHAGYTRGRWKDQ